MFYLLIANYCKLINQIKILIKLSAKQITFLIKDAHCA